jgi:hypothetical protein
MQKILIYLSVLKNYTMKNLIICGLFIMAMLPVQFVQAQVQTVDDVINKYVEALGGKEKLAALKSIKYSGSINIQGNDVTIVQTKLNMKGMRLDIFVAGTENYQIVTPEKGIVFMPVQGMTEPSPMPEAELKAGQNQLDVQGALFNYKEKGITVELLGTEKLNGEDNHKLKITFKNGLVTTCFIGAKNYRINKTVSKRMINGEEKDMETTYTNYKQNTDGFWFAYNSTSMQGEMVYDKIETNIAVDENIFKQ